MMFSSSLWCVHSDICYTYYSSDYTLLTILVCIDSSVAPVHFHCTVAPVSRDYVRTAPTDRPASVACSCSRLRTLLITLILLFCTVSRSLTCHSSYIHIAFHVLHIVSDSLYHTDEHCISYVFHRFWALICANAAFITSTHVECVINTATRTQSATSIHSDWWPHRQHHLHSSKHTNTSLNVPAASLTRQMLLWDCTYEIVADSSPVKTRCDVQLRP